MRDDLCRQGSYDAASLEHKAFPDGERYLRVATRVTGRDVVVVGGTHSDAATLELYDLACGIVKNGAARLTLVVPYFGYSTMERAVKPGEVVTAKTRARLLSAVPHAGGGNRVLLLDLHQEGIPHYFEGDVIAVHVYAKPVITAAIRRVGGDDFVLACTDAGRAKWVQSLANDLGVQPSFVFKRRLDGDQTEVTAVSAQVAGKRVVIYDDMIRTGGSLLGAARAYRAAGAASLAAVATHGVLPGHSLQKIQRSGLFIAVVCTDSHPRARELAPQFHGFLAVEPVAQVFLPYIQP
jgi:ribose-phosphate pyrophosphokinase